MILIIIEALWPIVVVSLLIAANAFFVAVEFGLVVIDRPRLAELARTKRSPWPSVLGLVRDLSYNLSAAQFGITISSLLLGFITQPVATAVVEPLLAPLLGEGSNAAVSVIVVFAVATVSQLVLGELVPKNVAIAEPERVMRRLGKIAWWYGLVAGPLVRRMNDAASWVVRRFGIEPVDEIHAVSSIEELEQLIRSSGKEGTLDPQDVRYLTRSIRFGGKDAEDAMVPRVKLHTIFREQVISELVDLAVTTGHSRFPVIGHDLDDVRGVVYIKAIYGVPRESRNSTPVADIMSEAYEVPETRDLESILREMRSTRQQLAIVKDEHGGTLGIVTAEDIVEEIVGEIEDEYDSDPETPPVVRRPGEFILDGLANRGEIEERCGLDIPDGEFETIAGFALDQLQRIPSAGELFEWNGWWFEIAEMERRRVATVVVRPPATPDRSTRELGSPGQTGDER